MEWEQQKYVNKLGYHWYSHPALTAQEKNSLYIKMFINYYGFFINKAAHLGGCYWLYKKSFFDTKSDIRFWVKFAGMWGFTLFSMHLVDTILRNNLFIRTEELREKYGTKIDEMRHEYQAHRKEMRTRKDIILDRLQAQGKKVQKLKWEEDH